MKKSKFNLSHPASFTAKMGNLYPFCVIDCLPGDTHRIGARSFIRAMPMLAPLMHQVNFFMQYWFVPYRLLWENWEEFITGGNSGVESFEFPTIKVTSEPGSLADYFGIPCINKGTIEKPEWTELEVSSLPFRAYAEIWNTRYRDQDLQAELQTTYGDGSDTLTNLDLQRCSWAKDYFTTARPFTQRGAQISVPVYSSGSLSGLNQYFFSVKSISGDFTETVSYTVNILSDFFKIRPSGDILFDVSIPSDYTAGEKITVNNVEFYFQKAGFTNFKIILSFSYKPVSAGKVSLHSEFSSNTDESLPMQVTFEQPQIFSSTSIDSTLNIRDLRLASSIQRYQERSAIWGNRYEEFIQREFGVRPRDARIQRPEYLGGAKTRLQISEVLQTAEGTDTGVGTMRGHGVGALSSRRIKFTCPEHGIIIGLFSVRPHSITTQGLNRMWRKFTKFDYFTPELANIGMQEVFQSELYANGENYDTVFGYSNRYDEYRKIPARISGDFRTTLDYWHLARIFTNPPVLNSGFVEMNPSTRIFAEQKGDHFLCMLQNDIYSYRAIPKRAKNILI